MRLSQIECGQVATIDAIACHIEALGGWLDLVASSGALPCGERPRGLVQALGLEQPDQR